MRFIPLSLLVLFIGFLMVALLQHKEDGMKHQTKTQQYFPEITLPLLGSDEQHFSPALWQGKKVVVNIFASWCLPCRLEHPLLVQLANEYSIPVYGIAWNDTPNQVKQWLKTHGNPYRAVAVDEKRSSTIALGLAGVPETFVIDDDGTILLHLREPLREDSVKHIVELVRE